MGNDVSKTTILSVERSVILLKEMGEKGKPVGVRELARELGYNSSTVQKLLNSLEVQGLVRKDQKTGGYELGLGVFRLGASVLNQLDVLEVAKPHLHELMEETGESSYLALLTPDRKRYVFVDKVESTHMLRWTADLGAWRPLNCTAEGKAMLAYLPDNHLDYLESEGVFRDSTPNSITEVGKLRRKLEKVREKGWAYSDEEFAEGVRAIAGPVFNYSGNILGAVSVVGPTLRLSGDSIEDLSKIVKKKSKAISEELGFEEESND